MLEVAVEVGLFQHLAAWPVPVQCIRAARLLYSLSVGVVIIGSSDASDRGPGQPVFAVKDILIGGMVIGIGRAGGVGTENVSRRVIAPVLICLVFSLPRAIHSLY